jgi:hypothetical protein
MTIVYDDGITTVTCGDGISGIMCSDPIPFGGSLGTASRWARERGWEITADHVRCPACGGHRRRAAKPSPALSPGMNRAERRGNPTHPHVRGGQRENVRNGGESV